MDRTSIYLPPAVGIKILHEISSAAPKEFYLNPGADCDALVYEAKQMGLTPILACSIVEIGATPEQFPDESLAMSCFAERSISLP